MFLLKRMKRFPACIHRHKLCQYSSNPEEFTTNIEDAIEKYRLTPTLISPFLRPKNFPSLKESVVKRKYTVDMKLLDKIFKQFDSQRKNLKKMVKAHYVIEENWKKNKDLDMLDELKKSRIELNANNKLFNELSSIINVHVLRIPNYIHALTPNMDTVIHSYLNKPMHCSKSHIDIGIYNSELYIKKVNSLESYFLRKKLALLESFCYAYFEDFFSNENFSLLMSPSIWKSVMFEVCGIDHNDPSRVLIASSKKDFPNHIKWLYLSGNSSFSSFAAFFTKTTIKDENNLPIRLFSLGKVYQPIKEEAFSLYNCHQSSLVTAFIVCSDKADEVVNEYEKSLKLLTVMYEKIGIHFQCISYGPTSLKNYESAATGFVMYSPFEKRYVEVARISILEDYCSRRSYSKYFQHNSSKEKYTNSVYITAMNITTWIGLMLENNCKSDLSYDIPEVFNFYFK